MAPTLPLIDKPDSHGRWRRPVADDGTANGAVSVVGIGAMLRVGAGAISTLASYFVDEKVTFPPAW